MIGALYIYQSPKNEFEPYPALTKWTGINNNYGLIGIKEDGTMVSDGLNFNYDLTVDGIDLIP